MRSIAVALTVLLAIAAVATAAQVPRPVKLTGVPGAGAVVAYGPSQVLLLNGGFGNSPGSITRVNLDGSVDRSFGVEGSVEIYAEDAVVTADGKILVATSTHPEGGLGIRSEARVTRLLPDGRPDPSFGKEGNVDIRFGQHYDYGEVLATAPNGDILLGGARVEYADSYGSDADLAVARLKPDGALDRSFGRAGVRTIPVGSEIEAMGIAAAPAGGVVLEGGTPGEAFLVKLKRGGSIDRKFGHRGFADITVTRGFVELHGGKLLVAGAEAHSGGSGKAVVVRLRADGHVDRSYGSNGWAHLPTGANSSARGLALLPGGALAIGATFPGSRAATTRDFGVVVFDRDGHPDRHFSSHGSCRARLAGQQEGRDVALVGDQVVALSSSSVDQWLLACRPVSSAAARAAVAQPPIAPVEIERPAEYQGGIKKAVAYGSSRMLLLEPGFGERPAGITRVNLDGTIDRSFGDQGTVLIQAEDAAVTGVGKILVATSSGSAGAGKRTARVIRLLPDGTVDPSFGEGGDADVHFGRDGRGQTLAVAPGGDILLGGVRMNGEGDPASAYITESDLAVARLKPDGSPDPSFGAYGVRIFPVGDEIDALDIAATPSGGVVVEEGNEITAYIGKLDRHGAVDPSFGNDGWVALEGKRGKSGERQLLLPTPGFVQLASGKLLLAASGAYRDGSTKALVLRLRADGRIDRAYGKEGWAHAPGRVETFAQGLTALPGGAVAVATGFERPGEGGARGLGAIVFYRDGQPDRKLAARGGCRAPVARGQVAEGIAAVAGRVVVVVGASQQLLECPPAR